VDVRGQTHVPARHFSLQSAYQSAGPGHSDTRHTRFCTHSKNSLRLSNFWMPYDLASLSTWNSLSSLCANISSGAGEILTFWHHMIITIPAELWGLITHILVYLWGLLLAGGMADKETISLCYLSTFAWIFPTISAVQLLAIAFLAITFCSNECVITGIEGLMSSGSVWQMWLAPCSGWGTHVAELSAWTSC